MSLHAHHAGAQQLEITAAEALLLGRRFAIVRNLWCLVFAVAVAYLTVGTFRLVA